MLAPGASPANPAPGARRCRSPVVSAIAKPPPTVPESALHSADSGTVGGGFAIADTTGDLHRLAPGAGFAGLAPGASIRIEYRTDPLLNTSFVPKGPYIVFDAAKDV